jgi:hypothetical protein
VSPNQLTSEAGSDINENDLYLIKVSLKKGRGHDKSHRNTKQTSS